MAKIECHIKQLRNGRWYAGTTFNGYDYCEDGVGIAIAQSKLEHILTRNGADLELIEWLPAVPFVAEVKGDPPPVTYRRNRIDNL